MPGLLSALVGDAEIEALFSAEAEIAALVQFEVALAGAEADVGLISADAAERITAVCEIFAPDAERLAAGLAKDGVVVPELLRQLRKDIGDPHAEALHLGATSQDVIDTGLMLRLKKLCGILDTRLGALAGKLAALSSAAGETALMAHTRMQVALPITAADKVESWAAPLRRHRERLGALEFPVQLGGPVGNGESFEGKADDIRAGLAERLGLLTAKPWQAERDRIADIAHVLTLIAGSLGKLGQDLALMAQNEVGAVKLAGGGGSSAMAHKQNPVGAEVLVALARFSAGLNGTLAQSMVHENERSGAAWTLEWMVLPQIAVAAGSSLRIAAVLLDGLEFQASKSLA